MLCLVWPKLKASALPALRVADPLVDEPRQYLLRISCNDWTEMWTKLDRCVGGASEQRSNHQVVDIHCHLGWLEIALVCSGRAGVNTDVL